MIICKICGKEMPDGICGYWKVRDRGINAHINCFESEMGVYKIQAVGYSSFYYEKDFPPIQDMLKDADIGEGYTITKETMPAGAYYCLPEFQGF